jgi:hypothetical protein
MGVKPKRIEDFYKTISTVLGLFQVYIIYLILNFVYQKSADIENLTLTVEILLGTAACFLGIILLNCEL